MTNLIKATCQIENLQTGEIISERIIGYYETEDVASFEAHKQRKDEEAVCLYNCKSQEDVEMSAKEMAEEQGHWDDMDSHI